LPGASKARWSSHLLLEELCRSELQERSRRSLERRLRVSAIKSFKPLADFEWNWPTKIDRDVIERALTLDFLQQARNLVLVGRNGLGKTLIVTNNRIFKEWNEVFHNATCIATMLDRLLHHADVTVIEGDSYRVRESEQEAAARRRKK